jgi:hypothetical protein
MSLWSDLTESANSAVIDAFGMPATLQPQDGSAAVPIVGVIQTPAMPEEFSPGGVQGVSVVRFFVNYSDIQPAPQRGDTVTLNGVVYVIAEAAVDTNGAAVLKLRVT